MRFYKFSDLIILYTLITFTSICQAEQRIVALSPAINEIVFAIGAGNEVVANTDYSNYPPESKDLPKVGGYFYTNLEQILAIAPTLVIAHNHDPRLLAKLNALHIKTVTVGMQRLDEIIAGIEAIGVAVNQVKAATQLANTIRSKIKQLKQTVKPTQHKILVVFGTEMNTQQGVYVSGNSLYFEDIIHSVGCENAFNNPLIKQPLLTTEGILAIAPDSVIILAYDTQTTSDVKVMQYWQKLAIPAAKNQQIHILHRDYAAIPSHRIIYLIDDFLKICQQLD